VSPRNRIAASATLHCLTGCAIGEILGLLIGTALGLPAVATIALAVALAFLFGYALSTLPLVQAGLGFVSALGLVFAADTLSIATMELVDNAVMALIPGAMDSGLASPVFWIGMTVALTAAFVAAFPVNRWLIGRGRGHALTHERLHGGHGPAGHGDTAGHHAGVTAPHEGQEHHDRHDHGHHAQEDRAPTSHGGGTTTALAVGIAGFLLGGLVAAVGAELDEEEPAAPAHGAGRVVGSGASGPA